MASDWSGLPHHLLSSVFERLASPLDYLRSSIVCMSWHCMAKAHEKQFAKMQSCHRSPPLLLIPTGKNNIWKVYNVMDDKLLDLQVRVPNKRFCGSSKGWLIVVERNYAITLINPFFRVIGGRKKENSIIRLPQLNIPYCESWAEDCNNFVFKASISADPILNANECIVTVIYQDKCQVAFIRLGKDTTWTFVDERYQVIEEVAAIENKFYAVDHFTKLLSFDITTQSYSDVKIIAEEMKLRLYNKKTYIVNLTEGEIIMLLRYFDFDFEARKRVTTNFKVFKLDFEKCKWIKKKTLGDAAIFLGDNSSISVLASEVLGCQPNCIYFNHDNECIFDETRKPHDFGVYNVKNRSFSQPYNTDAMTLMKMVNRPPIWIVPSLQL